MVVDDIHSRRESLSTTLRREQSFAVVGEVSGAEAVQMAKTLQPTIVVLETSLRDFNGLAIGHEILVTVPNTKIIYVCSEADYDSVWIAFRLGASAYVLKADAALDIVPAIHAVTRNEIFVSTQLTGFSFVENSS
jgi:DNA-binding NarL/FixJ family response regulator